MALGGTNRQVAVVVPIIRGDEPDETLTKFSNQATAMSTNPQGVQDNFEDTIDSIFHGGMYDGGVITDGGGLSIDISAGTALLHRKITFGGTTGTTVEASSTNYVFVSAPNAAVTVNQTGSYPSTASALIGIVTTDGSSVTTIDQTSSSIDAPEVNDGIKPRFYICTYSLYEIGSAAEPIYGDGIAYLPCRDDNTAATFEPVSGIAAPVMTYLPPQTGGDYEYVTYAYGYNYGYYNAEEEPRLSYPMIWYASDESPLYLNGLWYMPIWYRNAGGYLAFMAQATKYG